MSALRLTGSTSGYSEITPPAIAGDQTFTLPGTGGTLDRLNRAGNILQVVQATYGTQTLISSTSYVDTGLSASITPSSSSNKILVFASLSSDCYRQSNAPFTVDIGLVRASTTVLVNQFTVGSAVSSDSFAYGAGSPSLSYLDSPATTSSTTYKVQAKLSATTSSATFRCQTNSLCTSSLILVEVAA
jgi:hypothetical protein